MWFIIKTASLGTNETYFLFKYAKCVFKQASFQLRAKRSSAWKAWRISRCLPEMAEWLGRVKSCGPKGPERGKSVSIPVHTKASRAPERGLPGQTHQILLSSTAENVGLDFQDTDRCTRVIPEGAASCTPRLGSEQICIKKCKVHRAWGY